MTVLWDIYMDDLPSTFIINSDGTYVTYNDEYFEYIEKLTHKLIQYASYKTLTVEILRIIEHIEFLVKTFK